MHAGVDCSVEDIEGKTAREYALEALELDKSKKSSHDLNWRKRMEELQSIVKLLPPDGDKEGEIDETPNVP